MEIKGRIVVIGWSDVAGTDYNAVKEYLEPLGFEVVGVPGAASAATILEEAENGLGVIVTESWGHTSTDHLHGGRGYCKEYPYVTIGWNPTPEVVGNALKFILEKKDKK